MSPETRILTFEIFCIYVILNSVCHEGADFKHATLIFFLVDSLMMQAASRDFVTTLISDLYKKIPLSILQVFSVIQLILPILLNAADDLKNFI